MLSKDIIRRLAQKSDIDAVGFASIDCLEDLEDYLRKRQKLGFDCEFESKYLKERTDIKQMMSDAKTIISVAMSYNVPFKNDESSTCYISRFSRGEDYHKVLKQRMHQLISGMKKYQNFRHLCMVDTVPVVERWIAYKSGIGFYGKNCCIINQQYGSWIVLGEIIVDIKFQPDVSIEDQCIGCDKCIEACPTGAIKQGYIVDTNKCVSYLTQKKGYISPKYRELMGNNLYGCDACQIVCPHNKTAKPVDGEYFIDDDYGAKIDPKAISELTNREYERLYGDMTLAWRGKKILQRNSIIAMGNSGDRSVLPILEKYLDDQRPDIRGYAVWAIAKLGDKTYESKLKNMLEYETDEMVREELLNGIDRLKG
ncbi:MAG: tRNA epoxyqueuosine(34) reductase QueG [Clostridia bacterium]|nr:tRNA epoxyqueuosine(34) reductase QueG [Clostridia bacterium]